MQMSNMSRVDVSGFGNKLFIYTTDSKDSPLYFQGREGRGVA